MPTATAPFRADHVGSILRTAPLKIAREQHAVGTIDAAQLAEVENAEIDKIVRRQADVGLRLATDGEFRRSYWSSDFLWQLDGVERYKGERGVQFKGVATRGDATRIVGKIDCSRVPMLDHFAFLKANTRAVPKMTIPSPTVLHFRIGYNGIKHIYPDKDEFFFDLGAAYRKVVRAYYDAGCRYLQLDDTVWAYLCSPAEREASRQRGDDPDTLPESYARMINYAIADRPRDMIVTTHQCRGNFRSSWIAEGGYEPVAEVLFNELDYNGYFLEYDSDRAGGFEPLRFLPKGDKKAVLGLVTSKFGELEGRDVLRHRIDEAAKFAPLDQLCLSPQCGFASTEEGNNLSEEEQWAKLRRVVVVAESVWGKA